MYDGNVGVKKCNVCCCMVIPFLICENLDAAYLLFVEMPQRGIWPEYLMPMPLERYGSSVIFVELKPHMISSEMRVL